MEIKEYNDSFKYKEFNLLKPLIIIVVLLLVLIIILFEKKRIITYYSNSMFYFEKKFITFVKLEDLSTFTSNKEILIEGDIYEYEIKEISKETKQEFDQLYKEVKFEIREPTKLLKKENNYYNYNIVLKKESIISYIFKTITEE